jgi:hypothetical protein
LAKKLIFASAGKAAISRFHACRWNLTTPFSHPAATIANPTPMSGIE